MSLFKKTPQPPLEDPAVAQMRKDEQQRAEEDRIKSIQDQLALETRLRNQNSGVRSLFSLINRAGVPRGGTATLGSG